MRKRMIAAFFALALSVSVFLTGCESKSAQKAQEYKELGIKQMESADFESAADSFQKALDQSTGIIGAREIDLCYYKALAQFKAGNTEDAIQTYTALADYDKDNWEVYYLRGSVYLQSGQGKLCLKDYNQAISLNKKDLLLYAHIGESLMAAGYEEKGLTYLEQALELKPSSASDYASLGYIYFLRDDLENAEANLKKAVADGSDSALLYLGQVYAAEDAADQARTCFEQYMEKYPKDADAINGLGELALNLGEYADAVTYFEKALAAAGEDGARNIWRNLIAACEKNGDFARALQEAEDYLRDNPNDEEIQREIEFLKTRVSGDAQNTGSTDTQKEGQSGGSDDAQSEDQSDDGTDASNGGQSDSDTDGENDSQSDDGADASDDGQGDEEANTSDDGQTDADSPEEE